MKGILGLFRPFQKDRAARPAEAGDSLFFSTAFVSQGIAPSRVVPWEARAVEVSATRLSSSKGSKRLQELWQHDRYMSLLGTDAVRRMEHFFSFAQIPQGREIIRQEEHGDFMVVLLAGQLSVERLMAGQGLVRLAYAREGDVLGEMSLLDGGARFSACTTQTDCDIAVLRAHALDDMMQQDPQLAASLVALLARRLALRLRVVSARLSEAAERDRARPASAEPQYLEEASGN